MVDSGHRSPKICKILGKFSRYLPFKTSAKLQVNSTDAELARIQAFVSDAVGPLATVLHAMEDSGDNIHVTMEEAQSTPCNAVKLLGNASL